MKQEINKKMITVWQYNIRMPYLFVLLIFFSTSCKKFLDVTPSDAVLDEQTITDKASAENAVRGTYRALADAGYYGGSFQFDILLSGNVLTYTQSGASQLQFQYHTLTADNNEIKGVWSALYNVINRANHAITKIPAVSDSRLTDEYRNQLLGEAHFIRSLAYFDLARTWGGVQLFLTPTQVVNDKLGTPRSSLEQTYAQVLSDLKKAEGLLPLATVRNRVTKKTVWALRARFYLYQQQWANAETDATKLIADSTNYKLVKPYSSFYTQVNTTESVFELSYSTTYPNGLYNGFKSGGNYLANDSIKNTLLHTETGGSRSALVNSSGTKPFIVLYPKSSGTDPAYLIRIAELWLIRAEARAQQANISGALDDLNKVRNRAGLKNEIAFTAADVLQLIEKERKVEFAFEPHRWFDLIRTGRAGQLLNITEPNRFLFPIPSPDLEADPALKQNPGY